MEGNEWLGRFVWHELMTSDLERARAFYCELFNWSFELGVGEYGLFRTDGVPVAGVAPLPPGATFPQWVGCVEVPSVDRAVQMASLTGGGVVLAPRTSSSGRTALVLDPAGAPVSLWSSYVAPGDEQSLGVFCWDELAVPVPEHVVGFYQHVLGWTLAPFPGAPDTSIFRAAAEQVASMVRASPGMPAHWLPHVVVGDLADAREHARHLGGRVEVVAQAVPGVGSFSVITDSVGARLALFEPRAA